MQAPMTKARLLTLSGGLVTLALVSWWRLVPGDGPARPSALGPSSGVTSAAEDVEAIRATRIKSFEGRTMGTTFTLKIVGGGTDSLGIASRAVEAALRRVDEAMSTFNPESELSRLNQSSETSRRDLSPDLLRVLLLSQRLFHQTRGAFDVTVRPLVRSYGFGSEAKQEPPSEVELSSLMEYVGMGLLELDKEQGTVAKRDGRVEIDLSGVAKGYGVDEAARALEKLGHENYLVEVGGELRFLGTKPGLGKARLPWTLAIEEPDPSTRRLHAILKADPQGGALATSGDYRAFRSLDGKVISHTFDPRTGRPAPRRTASVSVLRPTAAEADALATALGVLTPEEAIDLADEHGWAIYLLLHQEGGGFRSISSQAMSRVSFERVESTGAL